MKAQFWVSVAGVTATSAAVFVALFGEKLRSMLFKPKLRLELLNPDGNRTVQRPMNVEARYYHLRATNKTRFPAAHEVQILLTALDTVGPNGAPQRSYTGDLPFVWMHRQLHSLTRTVGYSTKADVDLLFVRPDCLELQLMLTPNNLQVSFPGEAHLWITVIARGVDGESAPLRLKIDWDGKWERGEAEMRHHLVISPEKEA